VETDSVEYFFIDPSQNVCGNCLRYKKREEFAEMVEFAYEEQEGRKYLVYEKEAETELDTLTLEMMSNNRIDGVVPSNHIRIDDRFYMKYDITNLKSLREFLKGVVNREKIMAVMESIVDAAMAAEDYMLSLSSYVLDADYIYIDPSVRKVSMIVLPVKREEMSIDVFLKKLLMSIQYDQTEDCSYVVALINLFGGFESLSLLSFRTQIEQFKVPGKQTPGSGTAGLRMTEANTEESNRSPMSGKDLQSQSYQAPPQSQPSQIPSQSRSYLPPLPQSQPFRADGAAGGSPIMISDEDRKKIVHDLKREHDIDILFSGEGEAPKKEKKGFFFKKDKSEKSEKPEKEKKAEKKSFWEKLGKKKSSEKVSDMDAGLGGFAIPGMDLPGQVKTCGDECDKGNYSSNVAYREQEIAIPAQRIALEKRAVERQDFGKTEFIRAEEDDDETFIIGAEQSAAGPEYILYRRSTQESFRICEEIMRIGRSPAVTEICISGNKGIGRVHAILYSRGGQLFIEDNNSKNKTYVDGVQLEPGQSPRRIENGSRIRLGDEELEIHIQAGQ
jgi:hypothetical protein